MGATMVVHRVEKSDEVLKPFELKILQRQDVRVQDAELWQPTWHISEDGCRNKVWGRLAALDLVINSAEVR